ncbi:MAG TPA: hypothetical protein VEO54_14200 [Thermoanaerobaculia bacterium]|nr:hypothetical protein [Thermoanaerobaculia bacterium]
MKTKLVGSALVLDPAVLEQAGLQEGDEVEVSAKGGVITVASVRKLDQLLDEMDEQYGSVFKRLAE